MQHNHEILKLVIKANKLCRKQCISFKGHCENVAFNESNCGNVLALLKPFPYTNGDLQNHLSSPKYHFIFTKIPKYTYLLPRIKNETINIIGNDILQPALIKEIKEPKCFNILADEAEQLPICIKFIYKSKDILKFGRCEGLSGKVIATEIMRVLEKSNLNIKNCHGQGYDGASNMSSEAVAVQKQLKTKQNHLHSLHCCGHNLNLVITTACKITINSYKSL